MNKEFKDHGYIENVVNAGLEKYGIDGTLISLFNLSQLILEKEWVF